MVDMSGKYLIDGNHKNIITIEVDNKGRAKLECMASKWVGTGLIRGYDYFGVFWYTSDTSWKDIRGTHLGRIGLNGNIEVYGKNNTINYGEFISLWEKLK